MNVTRRRISAALGLSFLGSGCAQMGGAPAALMRRMGRSLGVTNPEDFYTSRVFGDITPEAFYQGYDFEQSKQAQAIFQAIVSQGVIPQQIPMPTEEQVNEAIGMFEEVKEKYGQKKEWELEDTYEVMQRWLPLIRMYFDVHSVPESPIAKGSNKAKAVQRTAVTIAPDGAITIPPGYMIESGQTGYCLDAGLPAPKSGERISLLPAGQLIPAKLMPLYNAMLQKAYADPAYRGNLQRLMWTLRAAGEPVGMASSVNQETLRQMELAMPGGSRLFADYHNANVAAKKLIQKAGEKLSFKHNGREINPADFLDPRRSQGAVDALFGHSMNAMNANVTGSAPNDGREFQMLTPTVAAYTTGSGMLKPQIRIANAGTKPASFYPPGWIGKPARAAQQIAMYPTTADNLKWREYPFALPDPQQKSQLEKLIAMIDAALLQEGARFLNDKILKNLSKTALFRDLAFRLLGYTPAVSKLVESLPYIGNAISAYEAISGKNWINGRDLNAFERTASILGIIPGANFFKSIAKERAVAVAQMAFAGLGATTNWGFMPDKVEAYVKTFTNPADATIGLVDGRLKNGAIKSLVDISESPSLSKKEKAIILAMIRDNPQTFANPPIY